MCLFQWEVSVEFELRHLQEDLINLGDRVPENTVVPIPEGKPCGALGVVLERSRQISLKQYMKPLFNEQGWRDALQNYRDQPLLTREQEAVFAGASVMSLLKMALPLPWSSLQISFHVVQVRHLPKLLQSAQFERLVRQ